MKRREQLAGVGARPRRWILSVLLAVVVVITMTPNINYASTGGRSTCLRDSNCRDIPITKTWNDAGNEDQRPEKVKVSLKRGEKIVDTVDLKGSQETNTWKVNLMMCRSSIPMETASPTPLKKRQSRTTRHRERHP